MMACSNASGSALSQHFPIFFVRGADLNPHPRLSMRRSTIGAKALLKVVDNRLESDGKGERRRITKIGREAEPLLARHRLC